MLPLKLWAYYISYIFITNLSFCRKLCFNDVNKESLILAVMNINLNYKEIYVHFNQLQWPMSRSSL